MAKEFKFDIFKLLNAADKKQMGYYSKLSADEKKSISMIVFMRWFSTISNSRELEEYQLLAVNEYLNKDFWELSDHPELIYKLSCLMGIGATLRHEWLPFASKKMSSKIINFFGEVYPRLSWKEIDDVISKYTTEDFKELLIEYGIQKDEEKELITAFKKLK